jgi:hypothetical protein
VTSAARKPYAAPAALRIAALEREAAHPRPQTVRYAAAVGARAALEALDEDPRRPCGHSEYSVTCTCDEEME